MKDQISHEFYEKTKEKSTKKPYAIRFKAIRKIMRLFSFFGNFISIFLAFFFFLSLFKSSFINLEGIGVKIGIVIFLLLFEWLKRKVFDLFSLEYVKQSFKLFKKQMTGFIISTALIIGLSMFFSMNGAQKFMNRITQIEKEKVQNIEARTDSINKEYRKKHIIPLKEQNKIYLKQKNEILQQRKKWVKKGWDTKRFDKDLDRIDNMIEENKEKINEYEKQKNEKIEQVEEQLTAKYKEQKSQNKRNIYWFVLISFSIELMILSGIYYNRYYDYKVVEEYERDVKSTSAYKKWEKSKTILEMIYETGVQPDEQISSTNEIIELLQIKNINISKPELQSIFRIFKHLKIYENQGNRRILKMNKNDAFKSLRNHFGIQ